MRNCDCPRDGSYLCSWCEGLLIRQQFSAWTQPVASGQASVILESAFQTRVRRAALEHGYLVYHTRDSRKSDKGFPDLVLVKPGRLLFVELKSQKGKLTQEQSVWLSMLQHSIPGVEAYCWSPDDWAHIQEILTP